MPLEYEPPILSPEPAKLDMTHFSNVLATYLYASGVNPVMSGKSIQNSALT